MLRIEIAGKELYDEEKNEIITIPDITLTMENSLVAISKWEAKYHKSFFKDVARTNDEILDYFYFMVYYPENLDENIFHSIVLYDKKIYDKIVEYINDPMTATYYREDKSIMSKELVTSEIIYYQMISYGIPVEFENWHIKRLLTLIKTFAVKNSVGKKRHNMRDIMAENDRINQERRKLLNTKG